MLVITTDACQRRSRERSLEPPQVTILAREHGVGTPVVARLVPRLHLEHLVGVAAAWVGHDELLHGLTNLGVVDAAIAVAVQSVEEPLGLISRDTIAEDSKETKDLVESDGTITSDLVPGTLELGLTLGSPDGLVVHVGAKLTVEDGIATREAASHGCSSGHAGHGSTGHGSARHHAGHGCAGHGSTGHHSRHGSARHGSTRHGSTRHHAGHGSTGHGSTRISTSSRISSSVHLVVVVYLLVKRAIEWIQSNTCQYKYYQDIIFYFLHKRY